MCVYYIYHTNLHICIHMHVIFLSFSLSLSSPSLSIFFFLLLFFLFSFDRVVCTYSLGYACMRVCSCVCACVCAFSGMQHILSISIPLCITIACLLFTNSNVSPCLSYIDCLSFSFINTACMWHGECVHARTDMCLSTGR